MYSGDFVVAIKRGNEFSKESIDGVVPIPFGSEYTIRLRNKNNRRAVATVYVDGENVTGGGIVVNGHSHVDLERSVDKAVKFKFVSAESGEAVDAGKNNRQDGGNGVIRVEWKLEKKYEPPVYTMSYMPPTFGPGLMRSSGFGSGGEEYTKGLTSFDESSIPQNCCDVGGATKSASRNLKMSAPIPQSKRLAEGCTVEGSYSSQSFTYTSFITEEGPPVIIQLKLKGFTPQAYNVVYCGNCGAAPRSNKDKFCVHCGRKL